MLMRLWWRGETGGRWNSFGNERVGIEDGVI